MENMTETKARFIRENPRSEMKFETVQTEYLKWLEDLAREQIAYNDALQLVSQRSELLADYNKFINKQYPISYALSNEDIENYEANCG